MIEAAVSTSEPAPRKAPREPAARASRPSAGSPVTGGSPAPRDDALASALQRCVAGRAAGRVLQRYTVDPLPEMQSQFTLGIGGFVDLNCGWYCLIAAIRQRRRLPLEDAKAVVPWNTLCAYSPGKEGRHVSVPATKPADLDEWETRLKGVGPVVVAGKLGRADWGILGGVDHFILIVGADAKSNTLEYMDPLVGNEVKTYDFKRANARMEATTYHVDVDKLDAALIAYWKTLQTAK